MLGSHMGVFPSYYEPWGYTPLEAGALGISAITTDLSGFGMYVKNDVDAIENSGLYVLDRLHKSDDHVKKNMSELFKKYVSLNKRERIENKINARKIASKADWKILIKEYIKAHDLALNKCDNP
jgi:glycogen(starch) synthase